MGHKPMIIQPGHAGIGTAGKGETLRITDVEGGQVGDLVVLSAASPEEHFNCLYTSMTLGRWKWKEGSTLVTNHMNPIMSITSDPTGVHFTGGGFCSSDVRRALSPEDNEMGCRDCLEEALESTGIDRRYLHMVSCFNVFMNVDYSPDGAWPTNPPVTTAGDYIEFQAEMDLTWSLSVCIWPFVNSGRPSPLRVDVG